MVTLRANLPLRPLADAPFRRLRWRQYGHGLPDLSRLDRDEALLRDAVQERAEALRLNLPEQIRSEVEEEERLLAALLARIEEERAA